MNRKQRRTAAKTGSGHDDDSCPGCNAKAVIVHLCRNEVRTASGEPVMYHTGTEPLTETTPSIFDFGILAVHLEPATATISVTSYGREVMRMRPDRVEVEVDKRAAWVKTLMAIRADLDAKFGRIAELDHKHGHTRHESAPEGDEEPLVCAGPDWEDTAREAIGRCGQFILGVFGEPGEMWFNHTVGNHEKNLPELIMVYPGRRELYETCGAALNRAGEIQRERGKPFEHGELVTLAEGKTPVLVVDASVRAKADYTHGVGNYYGTDDYQVRQLLYPDKAGRFPGDPLCAEPYASLPVLSPPPN